MSHNPWFSAPRRWHTGRVLVAMQFGLLAALAVLLGLQPSGAVPSLLGKPVPLALLSAAAGIGFWALASHRWGNFNIHPAPVDGGELVVKGPYRWVRHPMYTAVLLLAAAFVAAAPGVWTVGVWLLLAGVLNAKAALEEHWLQEHHPGYAHHMQGTARFVPGVW